MVLLNSKDVQVETVDSAGSGWVEMGFKDLDMQMIVEVMEEEVISPIGKRML